MNSNIFGAAMAFVVSVLITIVGSLLQAYAIKKRNTKLYVAMDLSKQAVQLVFFIVIFVLGPHTPWNRIWLLCGSCLGVTLPSMFITKRLVKLNDSFNSGEDENNG